MINTGMMGTIFGMQIIESPHLPEFQKYQFKFPRSKKKRIRKKWKNNDNNWKDGERFILHNPHKNHLMVHPNTHKFILNNIQK